MIKVICVPNDLIDTYINTNNEIVLKNKKYPVIKTNAKDTYIEVTYKI